MESKYNSLSNDDQNTKNVFVLIYEDYFNGHQFGGPYLHNKNMTVMIIRRVCIGQSYMDPLIFFGHKLVAATNLPK